MLRPAPGSIPAIMLADKELVNTKTKEQFDKLCKAARERDELALRRMKENEGLDISFAHENESVIMAMAREGNQEAVKFLLDNFKGAKIKDAVEGYARGGHTKIVDELRLKNHVLDEAVRGYAASNHVEQVNILINCGASKNEAARHYGKYGHVESLRLLIETIKSEKELSIINDGLYGLGKARAVNQSEAVILIAAKIYEAYSTQPSHVKKLLSRPDHLALCCRFAFNGYVTTTAYQDINNLFEMLIGIKSDEIYKNYVTFVKDLKKELNTYLNGMSMENFMIRVDGVRAKRIKNPDMTVELALKEVDAELAQPKPSKMSFFKRKQNEEPAPAPVVAAVATATTEEKKEEVTTPALK